jgi:hypothetical protein
LGCPDVARLTGGPGGVGTPVIGDRWIEGIRDLHPGLEIHVVARWGFTVHDLTVQVRDSVAAFGGPLDLIVDDIETPYDPPPRPPASAAKPEPTRLDMHEDAPPTTLLSGEAVDAEVVLVPVAVPPTVVVVIETPDDPIIPPPAR